MYILTGGSFSTRGVMPAGLAVVQDRMHSNSNCDMLTHVFVQYGHCGQGCFSRKFMG